MLTVTRLRDQLNEIIEAGHGNSVAVYGDNGSPVDNVSLEFVDARLANGNTASNILRILKDPAPIPSHDPRAAGMRCFSTNIGE